MIAKPHSSASPDAALALFGTVSAQDKIGFMAAGGSAKNAENSVQSEKKRWGDIIRRVGLEPK